MDFCRNFRSRFQVQGDVQQLFLFFFFFLLQWYVNQSSNCLSLSVSSNFFQDSKISSMERGLRDLEEEIQMLKSNGALSTEEREEEMKQMEVYRSHSKFMKNKVLIKQKTVSSKIN